MKRFIFLSMISILALAACSPIIDKQMDPVTAVQQTPTQVIETQTPMVEVPQPTATEIPTLAPTSTTEPEIANWIAFVGLDGNVQLVNPLNGDQKSLTTDGLSMTITSTEPYIQYSNPNWSSDGVFLVFKKTIITPLPDRQDYQDSLIVYDMNTEKSVEILSGETFTGFSWRPGTHVISYSLMTDPNYFTARGTVDESLAKGVMGFDVDTMQSLELVSSQGYSLIWPQWSPDGRFVGFDEILYMEGRGNFAYYDFEDQEYFSWERPIGSYQWSQDGELLVYDYLTYAPNGEERIFINDRYDEDETQIGDTDEGFYLSNPIFSADDEQIIYKETDLFLEANATQLVLLDLESNEKEIILEPTDVFDIVRSPDGETILVVIGPYNSPTLMEVNLYDFTARELGNGWWPAWQPIP
jgi:Tol biopolymer transport system component